MKSINRLAALLVIVSEMAIGASGGSGTQTDHRLGKITGTPAQTIIDINNVTTWVRADGFFDWVIEGSWNGTFPKGTIGCIFSQGMVWGGFVNDGQTPVLRVGGSTYRTGSVAGAILTDASGNATGRESPGASDVRIFRVRPDWATGDLRDDAANLLTKRLDQVADDDIAALRAQYKTDWVEWPAQKGAPYENRDGVPGYQPDANGLSQSETGALFDIPGIPGADQTVWYVANDLGPNAAVYGAPSIGLEMQMTLWAYSSELFSNLIFKRVRLIYKGTPTTPANAHIDDMFITQWSDPDLGDFSDDFAGCDTTLGLGFIYNASAQDLFYRDRFGLPVPSMGFDFLQGVIVPSAPTDTAIFDFKKRPGFKNLPMTTFSYFAAGGQRFDPDLGKYSGTLQWYNLMRGCEPRPEYPSCVSLKDDNGNPTRFELSGDPVAVTGDLDGRVLGPGDRRILLATGPFTMNRRDTQEVVIAQVAGLGGDNLSSISIMKNNDRFAQAAYDNLFKELPGAPPPPSVNVTELSKEIILNWGTDPATIASIENVVRQGWTFEGYNVYQMPSVSARFPEDAIKIATYDIVNGVRAITNRVFDPIAKIFVNKVRQVGSDGGVQRYISIKKDARTNTPLVNGLTYYFVVTAYSNNPALTVDFHALESRAQVLAVIPQSLKPGVRVPGKSGEELTLNHTAGESEVSPKITIVDPTKTTGHNYEINFRIDTSSGALAWRLRDMGPPDTILYQATNFGTASTGDANDDFSFPIIDGLLVGVKEQIPKLSASWVSPNPPWFRGDRFTIDPSASFQGGVTTGAQLPNYLSHVRTSYSPFASVPGEIRFNPAIPQKAYRMRRTGPNGGYMIQSTNSFVNLPFSAWDVSDSANPRQLTLAWRDQDDDGTWNPTTDDDGVEIVFVLYRTYDQAGTQFSLPPNAVEDQITKADVMYGLSLRILSGHTLNESVGTLSIIPDKHMGAADVYTFSTQKATSSIEAAKSDVEKINVFPNPYYGFNSQETDRLQKYVTFNHLPQRATIRIFNLGGVIVRVLEKNDATQFLRWNVRNDNNLPVASGVYIVQIDMTDLGKTKILKLAIVQEEQILRIY